MLTTKEAAETLGITAGRVRQLVLDGTLKAEKFGSNLAIHPKSVDAARKRKTQRGPKPAPKSGAKKGKVKNDRS